jgi:hypothetical protein
MHALATLPSPCPWVDDTDGLCCSETSVSVALVLLLVLLLLLLLLLLLQ